VPGITAALGCAAATGLPLTLRGTARAVTFVTAQGDGDIDTLDWPGLGLADHTIAIYMGTRRAAGIRDRLIGHGRAPGTPVAVIQDGTTGAQRLAKGTLVELPELMARHHMRAPALIVIGETAALADVEHASTRTAGLGAHVRWSDVALAG
jgi:uroporphyrin-III C-methyltransferase/precorrin-2 dehydrogenase/sirohydrochlorin ferrochelatase